MSTEQHQAVDRLMMSHSRTSFPDELKKISSNPQGYTVSQANNVASCSKDIGKFFDLTNCSIAT